MNNATTDLPMEQDLNCRTTLKSLLNYYEGLVERCLQTTPGCDTQDGANADIDVDDLSGQNPWADAGWPQDQWPTPWIRKLGPILCSDGQPTFGLLYLKEADAEY